MKRVRLGLARAEKEGKRDKGTDRWLSWALCDEFTRSALAESGDYIAAVQNENRNGAKNMKRTGKAQVSH
jgi:hypothetical protein